MGMEGDLGSYILEVSYLFLHLIAVALLFYLSFRAMKLGSFFIRNIMFDDRGYVYKRRRYFNLILGIIFSLLFIYSLLQVIGLNLPLYVELGEVVWHDVMNGFLLISMICFVIFAYSFIPWELRDDRKHM